MHIKQLILEGFKTYKERTILDPFSPHHNVIVGSNGSGKSNLLDAIQFVLSDKYHSMRSEERSKLLYEGSGRDILSASVEIIFDNRDSSFGVERDQVSIKRTIGLKKDEYFVDGKHTSKQDLIQLVELAGMNFNNPYHCVEQGRINSIIRQSPQQRLQLFKEVAGTRVYDERRKESQVIMANTDKRLETINAVVRDLDNKLSNLALEKQELEEWAKLDAQKRALEYLILEDERTVAAKRLSEEKAKEDAANKAADAVHQEMTRMRNRREEAQVKMDSKQLELSNLTNQRPKIDRARMEIMQQLYKHKEMCEEAKMTQDQIKQRQQQAEKELIAIDAQIKQLQSEIATLDAQYESALAAESKLKQQFAVGKTRLEDLYNKQSRKATFASKTQRDAELNKQLKQLKSSIQERQEKRKDYNSRLESLVEQRQKCESQQESNDAKKNSLMAHYQTLSEQAKDYTAQIDALLDAKRVLDKAQFELSGDKNTRVQTLQRSETAYFSSIDRETIRGLEMVNSIVDKYKVSHPHIAKQVHGPLIGLFKVDPAYQAFDLAIELTGASSLFHCVVETDEIAATLIGELGRLENSGRVTFISLNRAKPQQIEYPQNPDCIPITSRILFNSHFLGAVQQVFGRTMIVRDMTTATTVQAQGAKGFNFITLDGTRLNRKGLMSGGYADKSRTRLALYQVLQLHKQDSAKTETKAQEIKAKQDANNQQLIEIQSKHADCRQNLQALTRELDSLQQEVNNLKQRITSITEQVDRYRHLTIQIDEKIATLQQQIKSATAELASEFTDVLTPAEQQELNSLLKQESQMTTQFTQLSEARSNIEEKRNSMQARLSGDLLKQRDQLQQQASGATLQNDVDTENESESNQTGKQTLSSIESRRQRLAALSQEYARLETAAAQAESDLAAIAEAIAKAAKSQRAVEEEVTACTHKERLARTKFTQSTKEVEAAMSRRLLVERKRDDLQEKINALGSLPSSEIQEFQPLPQPRRLERMRKIVALLASNYKQINRKAADQYESFHLQRKEILKGKAENDAGRASILELIQTLDQRKHEAIERTFKTIAKHFSTCFAELVPGGKGTVVLQTHKQTPEELQQQEEEDSEQDDEDQEEQDKENAHKNHSSISVGAAKGKKPTKKGKRNQQAEVEEEELSSDLVQGQDGASSVAKNYSGVSLKVQFAGTASSVHQLSGGQQSIVGLALIFAIQRCAPSPFYIFDEIESALDPVHRRSVAHMIQQQKATCQFIQTTFAAESIESADRYYGVVFQNKMSIVSLIEKSDAHEFLLREERQKHDEHEEAHTEEPRSELQEQEAD